jgi:hypothetical protein
VVTEDPRLKSILPLSNLADSKEVAVESAGRQVNNFLNIRPLQYAKPITEMNN